MSNEPSKAVRLSALRDDLYRGLRIPFIPPVQLVSAGTFWLVAADARRNMRYQDAGGAPRQEIAFTVTLLEGELTGLDRVLTLESNPIRQRIMALVRKHGKIGPLALLESTTGAGTKFYQFGEPDPVTGVVAAIEDPAQDQESEVTE